MNTDPESARSMIQNAMAAMQRGDRKTARQLAEQAAALDPQSEASWLLLAALSAPADSLIYAQRALEINPESQAAEKALRWALTRLDKSRLPDRPAQPDVQAAPPPSPSPPPPAKSETLPEVESEPEREGSHGFETKPGWEGLREQKIEPEAEKPSAYRAKPEAEELLEYTGEAEPAAKITRKPAVRKAKPPLSPARILLFTLFGLIVVTLIAGFFLLRQQLGNLGGNLSTGSDCIAALNFEQRSYEIRTLVPKSDGSFKTPDSHPERLYWLKGTDVNLVFVMLPTADNLSLVSRIRDGQTVTLTWPNCSTTVYTLSQLYEKQPFNLAQLDQSATGITIFIPAESTSSGYLLFGVLQEQNLP